MECAKDLFIRYGIIGKNKGTVRVGGKVEARFIEICYVPYIVSTRLRKVRFALDKPRGKIVIRAC